MNKPISKVVRHSVAFTLALLLTACSDAQRSPGVSPPAPNAAIGETQGDGKKYSEPALTGRIVDAETKLPIQGAFIYGHYATSSGTLAGGSKFGEHVKSFAVETDANGVFKLDAWNSGVTPIQGETRNKFPMIAVYKPGYRVDIQNLNSVKQWTVMSRDKNATQGVITETLVDWTRYPYELASTKTERDRYDALDLSGYPMMMVGECGWEIYAGLLLAQHNELKDWYRRNYPSKDIDSNGYVKDTSQKPTEFWAISLVFKSAVDRLNQRFDTDRKNWNCKAPDLYFKDKK